MVALRKESVDRNSVVGVIITTLATSLSARRAWIEIVRIHDSRDCWQSLSARRAWIEIAVSIRPSLHQEVALRKESVDRNVAAPGAMLIGALSLSARRAWIEIRWLLAP